MENAQIPVDILRWSLALLPMIVLLVLLVFAHWRATEVRPIGMFVAGIVALGG